MPQEIERKWRLRREVPRELLSPARRVVIQQGYLLIDRGEVRIRRKGEKECFLTVKGDGGLVREEVECAIPSEMFEALWPWTKGQTLAKERYTVSCDGHVLEVDFFFGNLGGLVIMECEFASEEEAASFHLPDWAVGAEEVTEDKCYKNKHLARNGAPR